MLCMVHTWVPCRPSASPQHSRQFSHSCTEVPVTQRQYCCKLHAVTFNYCNTAAANKPKPDPTTMPKADDTGVIWCDAARGCSGCSYTSQGGALPAAAVLCCLRLTLSNFMPHCYSSGGLYNRRSTGTPSRLPQCARAYPQRLVLQATWLQCRVCDGHCKLLPAALPAWAAH